MVVTRALPPGSRGELVEHFVYSRSEDGEEQQAFVFDTRSVSEQLAEICASLGLQYDRDANYHVLTNGISVNNTPLRNQVEILALPQQTQLALHRASDVIEARIKAVEESTEAKMADAIRNVTSAVQNDPWMALDFIEKDGIIAVLKQVNNGAVGERWASACDLSMACICELVRLCQDEVVRWFGDHLEELGVHLFGRLFAVIFPPPKEEDESMEWQFRKQQEEVIVPRATLSVLLLLLQNYPALAVFAAEAGASGAPRRGQIKALEPAFPAMFAAVHGEDDDDFRKSAAIAILCMMVGNSVSQEHLRPKLRNQLAAFCDEEELEELLGTHSRNDHLIEQLLAMSVETSAELANGQKHTQVGAMQEVMQLREKVQTLQETVERLGLEVQQKHRAMCSMTPFLKVDSSLLVEQSLDSMVRFGWDSCSWRNDYTLLHFACDCLDDPKVLELVASFCKDIDQPDAYGKRPVDYARNNANPEMVEALENMRKLRRQDESKRKTVAFTTPSKPKKSEGDIRKTTAEVATEAAIVDELSLKLSALENLTPSLRMGIEAVLKFGWDEVTWPFGFSVAHLAAQLGHTQAMKLLVEAKADINAKDDWQLTPLDYAAQMGNGDMIMLLQKFLNDKTGRHTRVIGNRAKSDTTYTQTTINLCESRVSPNTSPRLSRRSSYAASEMGVLRASRARARSRSESTAMMHDNSHGSIESNQRTSKAIEDESKKDSEDAYQSKMTENQKPADDCTVTKAAKKLLRSVSFEASDNKVVENDNTQQTVNGDKDEDEDKAASSEDGEGSTEVAISSERYEQLDKAFSGKCMRMTTAAAVNIDDDGDDDSALDDDYGLSEAQLEELNRRWATSVFKTDSFDDEDDAMPFTITRRLTESSSRISCMSARDSEYGFSDAQLLELQRRYASMRMTQISRASVWGEDLKGFRESIRASLRSDSDDEVTKRKTVREMIQRHESRARISCHPVSNTMSVSASSKSGTSSPSRRSERRSDPQSSGSKDALEDKTHEKSGAPDESHARKSSFDDFGQDVSPATSETLGLRSPSARSPRLTKRSMTSLDRDIPEDEVVEDVELDHSFSLESDSSRMSGIGFRGERRLTEATRRGSADSVGSDYFGLSDQQIMGLNQGGWVWQGDARRKSGKGISNIGDGEGNGCLRDSTFSQAPGLRDSTFSRGMRDSTYSQVQPEGEMQTDGGHPSSSSSSSPGRVAASKKLRKQVSFTVDGLAESASNEAPAGTDEIGGGRQGTRLSRVASGGEDDFRESGDEGDTSGTTPTSGTGPRDDSLATYSNEAKLEKHLQEFFKDMPDFFAPDDVDIDGDAVAGESSSSLACKLVLMRGWNKIKWQNNFTGLHLAASRNDADAVRFLLDAKATVTTKDDDGKRAVDYAEENGCAPELIQLLMPREVAQLVRRVGFEGTEQQDGLHQMDAVSERELGAARKRIQDVGSMDPAELYAKLLKAEKERAALLEDRCMHLVPGGAALGDVGTLDEATLEKYIEQLQTFGKEGVRAKLQEPAQSGGLNLSPEAASGLVVQLEKVLKVSKAIDTSNGGPPRMTTRRRKRTSTWGGDTLQAVKFNLPKEDEEDEWTRLFDQIDVDNSGAISREEFKKAIKAHIVFANSTVEEKVREGWGSVAQQAAKKATTKFKPEDLKLFEGAHISSDEESVKSPEHKDSEEEEPKAEPSGKGKKGKGKGKVPQVPVPAIGGPKGKGKDKGKPGQEVKNPLTKPRLNPNVKMKPLWWVRYLKGVHLKDGETVWDHVQDELGLLDLATLEERFGKNVVADKKKKIKVDADDEADRNESDQPKFLRIITDPSLIAGREAALRHMPPAQEVATAILELDEQLLPPDTLQSVIHNAVPNPEQQQQLLQVREDNPTVPFAIPEQYMWVVMQIPGFKARLDVWNFVRTFGERRAQCAEGLRFFIEVADSLLNSQNLPSLMGVILAVGNYLNAGSDRGQADGFDLESLNKFESVKDAKGKDLRHIVFDVFFKKCPERAVLLFQDLSPLLLNVTRILVRDSDGAEKLTKKVNVCFEDYDLLVNSLVEDMHINASSMEMVLQYNDDPTDQFRLMMPEQMSRAKDLIGLLSSQRDEAKGRLENLLKYFRCQAMKSSDFVLLWDDFFVPETLVTRRPDKLKKGYLGPHFCGQARNVNAENIAVLWGLKDPEKLGTSSSQPKKAGLRSRVVAPGKRSIKAQRRASLTGDRRKSRMVTLSAQANVMFQCQQAAAMARAKKDSDFGDDDSDNDPVASFQVR